jgi:hypothetical protein
MALREGLIDYALACDAGTLLGAAELLDNHPRLTPGSSVL